MCQAPPLLLLLMLFGGLVDRLEAVKGCHLFNNLDSNELKAKCINPKHNFQVIPQNLNIDIVELTINNQFIESISSKQFSHLPNLTFLDLSSNGLKSIEQGTFRQLSKLTNLTLRGNRVSFERGSFFPDHLPGLKNLVHLDLRFNPIETIPDNFFSILGASLKVLQLSSTSTESVRIQPKAFDGLRNLIELDLSHGNLTILPDEMRLSLDRMPHLRKLDLRGNNWNCDCNIKWLKNWLEFKIKMSNLEPYSSALGREAIPICYHPMHLRDRTLIGASAVSSDELRCAPTLLNKGYPITIDQRSNLTLVCQFHADPVVSVDWFKDDKKVDQSWQNVHLSQNYSTKFDANLTIYFVGRQHQGRWSCIAGTGKDRVSTDYHVQVLPGTSSGTSILNIFSPVNTFVLKYTGLASACLLLLIIIIGLIVYGCCVFRRGPKQPRKKDKPQVSNSNSMLLGFEPQKIASPVPPPELEHFHATSQMTDDMFSPYAKLIPGTSSGLVQVCSVLPPETTNCMIADQGGKLEDYVAFRVVSPTDPDIQENLHNFSIQPLTVLSPFNAPENGGNALIMEPQKEAYFSSPSHSTFIPTGLVSSSSRSAMFEPIITASMELSSYNAPQSGIGKENPTYSPCPLHGNLIATSTTSYNSIDPSKQESIKSELSTFCASLGRNRNKDKLKPDDEGYNTAV